MFVHQEPTQGRREVCLAEEKELNRKFNFSTVLSNGNLGKDMFSNNNFPSSFSSVKYTFSPEVGGLISDRGVSFQESARQLRILS